MNKHWVFGLAAAVILSACSRSTQLAVRAVTEGPDGEPQGQPQLIVRLLPYDRDSIFDALARRASEAEPQPPADLIALRDSVSAARQRWTEAEGAWNEVRSEMLELSERMEDMNRASAEYARLFTRFDELERQVGRLERMQSQYFDQFTELQDSYQVRADSFNAVIHSWGDAAFEDYAEIVDSLTEARGEELVDTTNANGWADFSVPGGRWWLHTRTELVFEELYWNVPYRSTGGVDTLMLDTSNAETRLIF